MELYPGQGNGRKNIKRCGMIKYYECEFHQASTCFEKEDLKKWCDMPICVECFEEKFKKSGWCELEDFEPNDETEIFYCCDECFEDDASDCMYPKGEVKEWKDKGICKECLSEYYAGDCVDFAWERLEAE